VLELGTARGGTLFVLTSAAADDAVLVAVDMPEGQRSFGGNVAYQRRRRLFESFARQQQRVVYLARDSHRPETLAHVRRALDDRPLDLLFIDGDHSYDGVAADFETYVPLVRRGGIVALHDIVPGPPEAVGGVPDFWRQVRDETAVELVEDWDQGGWGIGVLRV
jgi:predicted O-methyltransferase YrrM